MNITTQTVFLSSHANNLETKKQEGPKLSVTIGSFIQGLVQDVRDGIFATYKATSSTTKDNIYYEDHFNDLSWNCTVGTSTDDGIWYNQTDYPGIIMSCMVWVLILYSGLTVTLLAQNNRLSPIISGVYCTICSLALACHGKTSLTDPGAVPISAVPLNQPSRKSQQHPLCMKCNTYKPPKSHHCRICNRCIAGMDHHCPW